MPTDAFEKLETKFNYDKILGLFQEMDLRRLNMSPDQLEETVTSILAVYVFTSKLYISTEEQKAIVELILSDNDNNYLI